MAEDNASAHQLAPPQQQKPSRSLGTRLAVAAGILIGPVVLLRLLAFNIYSIPSGSMVPTLRVGDYIAVATYPYGDVVVFRPPGNPQETFIKRVIGQPGDKVQLKGGVIYINDAPVSTTRTADYLDGEPPMPPRVRWRYVETLPGGRSYEMMLVAGGAKPAEKPCDDPKAYSDDPENTCPFLVPPDHFFVLGDNRDNSADSRIRGGIVGMVPAENLIGRAAFIVFSWGSGPQLDRIGKSVR
jgi:signal peptidase I